MGASLGRSLVRSIDRWLAPSLVRAILRSFFRSLARSLVRSIDRSARMALLEFCESLPSKGPELLHARRNSRLQSFCVPPLFHRLPFFDFCPGLVRDWLVGRSIGVVVLRWTAPTSADRLEALWPNSSGAPEPAALGARLSASPQSCLLPRVPAAPRIAGQW